ncbi:glycosyltransferase family 4 protein, partial [Candidatus Woesearchaeota archaeon]|nr:glycosyltransferase family 4 protein [Candidatus Woesearchaeota archaeon]
EEMKILITTDNFLPRWDGIARFLNEILPRLKGNEITVVAPDFGKCIPKGFTLISIPLGKRIVGDYRAAKYDFKTVKAAVKEADIIFNQTLGPIGIAAILSAKSCGKPIVSFTHSLEWELVPRALHGNFWQRIAFPLVKLGTRFLLNRCTALIVPSEQTADRLTWQGILTTKRVVHLGVDINKFKPGSKASARKKLKLSQNNYIIGYHGRIAHEKNLPTLLRSYLQLDIENKNLLIVGDGVDELKKKLKRKGVIITGTQNDVVPYLQAMDLYVLPSMTETTSLSVLEAMACGIPVISSKVGFIRDYITEGKNGFFFDKRKSYDLLKKIRRVRKLNHKEITSVKAAARATVEQGFNWTKAAKGIVRVLREFSQNQ